MTTNMYDPEPSAYEFLFWLAVVLIILVAVTYFCGAILGILSIVPAWAGAFIFWRIKIRR